MVNRQYKYLITNFEILFEFFRFKINTKNLFDVSLKSESMRTLLVKINKLQ